MNLMDVWPKSIKEKVRVQAPQWLVRCGILEFTRVCLLECVCSASASDEASGVELMPPCPSPWVAPPPVQTAQAKTQACKWNCLFWWLVTSSHHVVMAGWFLQHFVTSLANVCRQ